MSKKKAKRPGLFVASSKENLDYAYAIQQNLEEDAEVTVWTQGIFQLSKTSIESLLQALDGSDFAVFVFAPNDILRIRKKTQAAVRDNVIFELGLFMGKLGPQRTFIVVPKGSESLRVPTDLIGITPGKFDPDRNDENLQAAFGPFCSTVRRQVKTRGKRPTGNSPLRIRRDSRFKGLSVLKALYGYGTQYVDVTSKLTAAIGDGRLRIAIGNNLAGDPAPNIPKEISVEYKYQGRRMKRTVPEGAELNLP